MIKILLTEGSDTKIVELLNEIPEVETELPLPGNDVDFQEKLSVCDALILNSDFELKPSHIDSAKNLKLVIRQGNGSVIPVHNLNSSGDIVFKNTPNATAVSVAEYGLAVLLGICRFIGPVYRNFRNRDKFTDYGEGLQLSGKVAGILGYGRIGREMGARLKALGMDVLCSDFRSVKTSDGVIQADLNEVLIKSDVIMIHLPQNESSVNLLSGNELALLKSSAIIVDMSGGGVIDLPELMKIIDTDRIYGVALNLCDREDTISRTLSEHHKIYPAPRLGESTKEARELSGVDVISHVRDFFNV